MKEKNTPDDSFSMAYISAAFGHTTPFVGATNSGIPVEISDLDNHKIPEIGYHWTTRQNWFKMARMDRYHWLCWNGEPCIIAGGGDGSRAELFITTARPDDIRCRQGLTEAKMEVRIEIDMRTVIDRAIAWHNETYGDAIMWSDYLKQMVRPKTNVKSDYTITLMKGPLPIGTGCIRAVLQKDSKILWESPCFLEQEDVKRRTAQFGNVVSPEGEFAEMPQRLQVQCPHCGKYNMSGTLYCSAIKDGDPNEACQMPITTREFCKLVKKFIMTYGCWSKT